MVVLSKGDPADEADKGAYRLSASRGRYWDNKPWHYIFYSFQLEDKLAISCLRKIIHDDFLGYILLYIRPNCRLFRKLEGGVPRMAFEIMIMSRMAYH